MADVADKDVAERIQTPGFHRVQPPVSALTDPIADTPMVVTLDELLTYDSDPRVTRNPKYDELKVSIRERGLDTPPPITRRPGEPKYIIRNGGNTRLSILRELWAETKDERFFRIHCLFRPWPERGEVILLAGHLVENDLHGSLTFIERALAVDKARLLYEAETGGGPLSQSELARRLTAEGYPITQSQISRMQDTIRHVLPAIPTALYGGLGRDQIERITALRKAAARVHGRHVESERMHSDFAELFQEVLAQFDGAPDSFNVQRVRDELIGQLSSLLEIDYDSLALEVVDAETRPSATTREQVFHVKPFGPQQNSTDAKIAPLPVERMPGKTGGVPAPDTPAQTAAAESTTSASPLPDHPATPNRNESRSADAGAGEAKGDRARGNAVTTSATSERVQAIRRLVADATGEALEDLQPKAARSAPADLQHAGEIWNIEPKLDGIEPLRLHAAQLAREIADEVGAADLVESVDDGIGFTCSLPVDRSSGSLKSRASLMLLGTISQRFLQKTTRPAMDDVRLSEYLTALLMGERSTHRLRDLRLNDASLAKFFRLIRLGRRILELQADGPTHSGEAASLQ